MRNTGLKIRMVLAGTILFAFYAAFATVAYRMGVGLPIVVAGSLLFVAAQYFLGLKPALRSVNATDLSTEEYPEVSRMADDLCAEMEMDRPRLMIGTMGVPNAFAVGRKGNGVVVLSESIIELLDEEELEGVLAHEFAHVRNRDVVMMQLGQSLASLIGLSVYSVLFLVSAVEDSFTGMILALVLSTLVQLIVSLFVLAISRYREYVADRDAVAATGNPEAITAALEKLAVVGRHEDAPDVSDNVAAMCVFGGKRDELAALFSPHPPMEKRIARIQRRADLNAAVEDATQT